MFVVSCVDSFKSSRKHLVQMVSFAAIQVKAGTAYHSCCVVVKNMQRCVYAIANKSSFNADELMKLEKDAEESRISPADFLKKLQVS